ncbi:hypothetical protein Mapa_001186 [Marchantia paleacea]|nr:hypothetical protein Mapa_001186 [Marchantia paleacea]
MPCTFTSPSSASYPRQALLRSSSSPPLVSSIRPWLQLAGRLGRETIERRGSPKPAAGS